MDESARIQAFLSDGPFAVAGASTARHKYGNKVLRCYQQHGLEVYALNPRESEVEGAPAAASLADLPAQVRSLSLVTPPAISAQVVDEAIEAGVEHLWFQPGAEDEQAIERAQEAGLSVIADGACLLVVLGYREG